LISAGRFPARLSPSANVTAQAATPGNALARATTVFASRGGGSSFFGGAAGSSFFGSSILAGISFAASVFWNRFASSFAFNGIGVQLKGWQIFENDLERKHDHLLGVIVIDFVTVDPVIVDFSYLDLGGVDFVGRRRRKFRAVDLAKRRRRGGRWLHFERDARQ